tara:strand:- start:5788 stop:6219 length:432 start_codon:yes stop_codon:yes gene_type:complete
MSFILLKNKLKAKLLTVGNIQGVYDYPTEEFDGFPAAVVRTDGNTSEYETNTENTDMYTFTAFLFQNVEGPIHSIVKAREIIEELCDTIRTSLDTDEFLNGLSMPTGHTIMGVSPTVSNIFETENGKYVAAEISISIRVSKNI